MSKAKRTSYKPGQSGNPKGRPKLPEEVKKISEHTKSDIIRAYYAISRMCPGDAEKYKPVTVLELGIMKCFADFARTGRTDQMRHLWAECHGKPKESIDLNHNGNIGPITLRIMGKAPDEH